MRGIEAGKVAADREVLSGEVMARLLAAYPDIQRRRWKEAVLSAFLMSSRRYGRPEDFRDMVRDLALLPDAFAVSRTERFVHFFEIEVYSPMRNAKLEAYGRFGADLSYYGIEFGLLVINKYGHINAVDWSAYYLRSLGRLA